MAPEKPDGLAAGIVTILFVSSAPDLLCGAAKPVAAESYWRQARQTRTGWCACSDVIAWVT